MHVVARWFACNDFPTGHRINKTNIILVLVPLFLFLSRFHPRWNVFLIHAQWVQQLCICMCVTHYCVYNLPVLIAIYPPIKYKTNKWTTRKKNTPTQIVNAGVRVSFNLICCQCARNTKLLFSFNYLSIFHFGKFMCCWCLALRVQFVCFTLVECRVSFISFVTIFHSMCMSPNVRSNQKMIIIINWFRVWISGSMSMSAFVYCVQFSIDLVSVIFHLWSFAANHQCTQSISRIIALIYRVNGLNLQSAPSVYLWTDFH